jgi:hypothetical protein
MKGTWPMVVGCVLLGAHALAADPRDAGSFDALDKDKDGVITASEARADPSVAARFAAADKNQDGYLSRSEFNELRKP